MAEVAPREVSKYGWRKDSLDDRDHLLSLRSATLLPMHKDLRASAFMPPVYDQGRLGSCTANGIGCCVQYDRRKLNLAPDFVPSRLGIYYGERVIEGSIQIDAGAEIRDGMKVVNKEGVADEALWPYITGRYAQKPPPNYYIEAEKHQVIQYSRVAQDSGSLRTVLAQGFPIVFGFTVYDSFESQNVARTGMVPMPDTARENVLGGHCVVLVGYTSKNLFIVRNSWGTHWGDGGYCYIPFQFVTNTGLCSDFWVATSTEA